MAAVKIAARSKTYNPAPPAEAFTQAFLSNFKARLPRTQPLSATLEQCLAEERAALTYDGDYCDNRHYWEAFYEQCEDPYRLATNPRELDKYQRTMRLLNGRRYGHALELGCAEGVFSEVLARTCGTLLAVDIAETAIDRARRRVGARSNIQFARMTLPDEMPDAPYDLIVASDVMYCWTRPSLHEAIARLPSLLSDGGAFFAVHWRGDTGMPLTGDSVHDLLAQRLSLAHTFSASDPEYRIDRFERRS